MSTFLPPQHDPKPAAATTALASLALTMLLSSLGTSIANVGLPTFVHVFEASFQSVQWIVLAYLLAVTTVVVTAGRLGDLLGRRRLILVGISLFTLPLSAPRFKQALVNDRNITHRSREN